MTKARQKKRKAAHFRQNAPDPAARLLAEAVAHHQAGRLPEAARLYRVTLGLSPRHADALRLLGWIYVQDGKPEQALPLLQDALQAQPKNPETLNWLGIALGSTGRYEEAATRFRQALAINPAYAEALNNLGTVAQNEGKLGEALKHYNQALTHEPECEDALWGKGGTLLALGEYREGWRLYETGLGRCALRGLNPFAPVKPWDGQPAPNKHLLIWSEQGLGDSLQFIRYAELCKQRVGKVSVACQKPLVRLFKALPYIDAAFDPTRGGNFDTYVLMMSLPHRFDTVLETVPAAVPYLRVDPEIQAKWAARFMGVVGLKVGLVWAGGSHKGEANATLSVALERTDRQRSVGLERMTPWLDLPGARFYNLQMDKPAEQIAALGLADRLTDFMGEVADFADTAAIVQNLDLVITVDTSVAHLAGGLGKPVWILSRYNACWRWLQNRPASPWYPTARIFGQPALGDWDSVMTEVGRELTLEIARRSLTSPA